MVNVVVTLFILSGISGKIQGTVTDADTRKPIPYADIMIKDTEIGTASDDQGYFYILNIPPGHYTVEASCMGYQTQHIKDIVIEIDQTVRLAIELKETAIEMAPVTVTSEMPAVKKDMIGTTYIVRKAEVAALPVDYVEGIVSFQPSVVHTDTALHVRGGRATEVQYMIDNVSIIDPQTGDLAINLSKGIVDEVIFLPGGFDAEYGRAMSGVINMITAYPSDNLKMSGYGKTERIMPFYYDFGYENVQSSAHLPVSKRFKGFLSFDALHTDDWNPKLFILPHKQRDDYSIYGKWLYAPSATVKLSASSVYSRTQFDRYDSFYKYYLDHYRSDLRRGNLELFTVNFLPSSRTLFNATFSRLFTRRIYGVREGGDYNLFEDFRFRDYTTLTWPRPGIRNPFGVYYKFAYGTGDYPQYQNKSSLVMRANLTSILQIHKYHELRTGVEYTNLDLNNFTYFVSDTLNQIIDEYRRKPREYAVYFQDNIDYGGLYAKIGCRYDRFSSDVEGIEPVGVFSPRFGFSFMVTDKFLFRANIGRFMQPPLYDHMYSYVSLLPLPPYLADYVPLVGNPRLTPEKTVSYEIGLQGEIQKNVSATVNLFYKDIGDLIGTRFVSTHFFDWGNYVEYQNIEYANVKGLEAILEFANAVYTGKISYTLSWARGTSSYAEEVYNRYYRDADSVITYQAQEYYLDFDQRHRLFIQGTMNLPFHSTLYLFGYIGDGFPYTPPGPEGKYEEINVQRLPFQKEIDCVISKPFKLGGLRLAANVEVVNLLDARNEIAAHFPFLDEAEIDFWTFNYILMTSSYYSPAADLNHDGMMTPREQYIVYKEYARATDDWVNAYSPPRRARIGFTLDIE